jgi:hypothetical protein
LGLLGMVSVLNSAGEIEGPIKNNLKDSKGKTVVLSGKKEDSVMGQKEFGFLKNKEMGSKGAIGKEHFKAQRLNEKKSNLR